MLIRERHENREEWLAARKAGIGASEAAAVIGKSSFMSNMELWRLKTGRAEKKDMTGNSAVEYGNRLEPAMRVMFEACYPEYKLDYHPFDILYQDNCPFIRATLDGELTEIVTGKRGILEIKTAMTSNKMQWDRWKDGVPQGYYCQCLHQMIATGWDFVILYAKLTKMDGDCEIRKYQFEREACVEDMEWLKQKSVRFWKENVVKGIQPSAILPEL